LPKLGDEAMFSPSRRAFLATSSYALAGTHLGWPRNNIAPAGWQFPLQSGAALSTFFPDLVDADTLRSLALTGIDSARQAGAQYADIRIADTHRFNMRQFFMLLPLSRMAFEAAYGLRVQVDAGWAFVFGMDLSQDSITRACRHAVDAARAMAKINKGPAVWASAPVVRGEWTVPVEIDPFKISPNAHAEMLGACKEIAERMPNTLAHTIEFDWTSETRVFASTDGSLTTQRLIRSNPCIRVQAGSAIKVAKTVLSVPGFTATNAGVESVSGSMLQERIKQTTEDAVRLSSYPEADAEVGRYDAVMDGSAVGAVLGTTLAHALELGRALGYEANGAGTSFLAPAGELLGTQIFSPHLTVTANVMTPADRGPKWDDEGVAIEPFPVIRHGCVVDYFATRQSAPMLASRQHGQPVRPRGSAVSWTPALYPEGYASQLTMEPSTAGTSLDALIKEVSNGILVWGVNDDYFDNGVKSDQQLANGWFVPMALFEVKRGKIVRRLTGGAVQFSTKRFFNGVTGVGGASTRCDSVHVGVRGEGGIPTQLPVSAPAVHLSQLDVTSSKGL
jgi:TldD protein